jgi:hypothetical protein
MHAYLTTVPSCAAVVAMLTRSARGAVRAVN